MGLASERTYTLKTLPQGILRGLADTLFRRDITGLARAGAILVGLSVTTAGYIVGCISSKLINANKRTDTVDKSVDTTGAEHSVTTVQPMLLRSQAAPARV